MRNHRKSRVSPGQGVIDSLRAYAHKLSGRTLPDTKRSPTGDHERQRERQDPKILCALLSEFYTIVKKLRRLPLKCMTQLRHTPHGGKYPSRGSSMSQHVTTQATSMRQVGEATRAQAKKGEHNMR